MTINVPPEYEAFVRQAVASGAFKNPEDAIRRALQLLEAEQRTQATTDSVGGELGIDDTVLPDDVDPHNVARMQGVGPIQDPDAGAADSWPPHENMDQWLADLNELRGHGTAREIP